MRGHQNAVVVYACGRQGTEACIGVRESALQHVGIARGGEAQGDAAQTS
jgi:hypothetical protein